MNLSNVQIHIAAVLLKVQVCNGEVLGQTYGVRMLTWFQLLYSSTSVPRSSPRVHHLFPRTGQSEGRVEFLSLWMKPSVS